MHIDNLKAKDGSKELDKLKAVLKRTVRVSKTIWEYRDIIESIKEAIASEDLGYASGMWHDLEYKDQDLLITAYSKGGVFTPDERAIIKEFWKISAEDVV